MDEKLMRHGAFSWFELMTTDVEGAKSFYSKLLGWTMEDMPMEEFTYTVVKVGDDQVAGIMSMPPGTEEMPPAWGNYITVDDVDAIAKQAVELGGKVLVEPRDIPEVGRFAVVQDPQGAWFSPITYVKP
jgi:predicted enzyme related to lactoylglutathione lyase